MPSHMLHRPDDLPRGRLARGLGWASLALGAAQLAAPDALNRCVGIAPGARTRTAMRGVGLQEATVGIGLLRAARPTGWLVSRVAGDLAHLGLLHVAAGLRRSDERRVAVTASAVAGIAVLDLVASLRERRRSRWLRTTTAITVNRTPEQVYRRWRDLRTLPEFMLHLRSVEARGDGRSHWVARGPAGTTVEWDAEIVADVPDERIGWRSLPGADVENRGVVRFSPAPGGRGTEVRLELEHAVPGGRLGRLVAAVFGEHPEQQAKDDLRRFKQLLETGEVVRSASTPDGTRSLRQWSRQPARPPT